MAYDKSFCDTPQEQIASVPSDYKTGGGKFNGEPGFPPRTKGRGPDEKTYEDIGGKPTDSY